MPKNVNKDSTNTKVVASVTVDDALGRGDDRGQPKAEQALTPEERVAVRTEPSAATALDGKYRKRFVVGNKHGEITWDDPSMESWHAANKTQTMQSALLAGLHPKAEAVFEGVAETTHDGNDVLVYAVDAVPAALDETPDDVPLVVERPDATEVHA